MVTPESLPLARVMLPGNNADKGSLLDFLALIEHQHRKVRRVWITERGIPTAAVQCRPLRVGCIPINREASSKHRFREVG